MAQELSATMTCVVLGSLYAFAPRFSLDGSLKAASRHRPIAIVPEGLAVRYAASWRILSSRSVDLEFFASQVL
jgi:hypothetical protein